MPIGSLRFATRPSYRTASWRKTAELGDRLDLEAALRLTAQEVGRTYRFAVTRTHRFDRTSDERLACEDADRAQAGTASR